VNCFPCLFYGYVFSSFPLFNTCFFLPFFLPSFLSFLFIASFLSYCTYSIFFISQFPRFSLSSSIPFSVPLFVYGSLMSLSLLYLSLPLLQLLNPKCSFPIFRRHSCYLQNFRVSELLDYTAEELTGKNLYALCHGEDANKLRKSHLDRKLRFANSLSATRPNTSNLLCANYN